MVICLLSYIFSFYLTAVDGETHHTETLIRASKLQKDGLFSLLFNLVTSFLAKWYLCVRQTGGEQGPLRTETSLGISRSKHMLWRISEILVFFRTKTH